MSFNNKNCNIVQQWFESHKSGLSNSIEYNNGKIITTEISEHLNSCSKCETLLNTFLEKNDDLTFIKENIKKVSIVKPPSIIYYKICSKLNLQIESNNSNSIISFLFIKALEYRLLMIIFVMLVIVLAYHQGSLHKRTSKKIINNNEVHAYSLKATEKKLKRLSFLCKEKTLLSNISFLNEQEAYSLSQINFITEEELWLENSQG